MKSLLIGMAALSWSVLGIAQAPAPTSKDAPVAASRDAPAAVDLTKKGLATGLPPAAAAKAGKPAETPTRKGPSGAPSGDGKAVTVKKGTGGGNPSDAVPVDKPKGPTPGINPGNDSSAGKAAPNAQSPK